MKNKNSDQLFAIRLSFGCGIVMLIIKWYAYYLTGSTAILSDAAESVVHIIGVAFAVYSLRLSIQPADASHPYGHKKINYFSAGFEGFLILLAAIYILYISIERLIVGVKVTNLDQGIYFTIVASVINLFLGVFLQRKGKKTNSLILVANGKHVLTDSWTSFGVAGGLLLTWMTGWLPIDPIVAIVTALNILWSGGKLIRQSAGGLMDEGNKNLAETISKILDNEVSARALKYHQLRYRESGNVIWIEFHLLFPEGTYLEYAHRISSEIEKAIKDSLKSEANIVTHMEPIDQHIDAHDEVH